jgi:ABC-type Fe3+/spermidine/putrescine transport system ATPase subunit
MVEPYHRDIGMVFQSYAIWPHLTEFENVAFPLRIRRAAEVGQRVMRALEMVGLSAFRERSSQQLSGGQQQRVAVARAIVHAPAVLLFDEPLSNLDAKLRDQTRAEIRKLQRELAVSTVYVTHDQAEALSLSDRILVMREGIIRQQGTPLEVYGTPADAFVADVVGPANFLPVTVSDAGALLADGTVLRAVGSVAPGAGVAMVRPDRIVIGSGGDNQLAGSVRQRLYLGGHYEYLVMVGPALLRVLSSVTVAEGDGVTLSFAATDCIILAPTEGERTPWA